MRAGRPFPRAHPGPLEISMRRLVLATLAAAALAGPALAANTTPPTAAPKFESVPQDAVLSYNLIGLNITDAQNNTVGEIKDIAIHNEKVVGYIVSVGGFLGMGEHYVAVSRPPWPWATMPTRRSGRQSSARPKSS